ncbi:MAG TPA: polysaccharide deacetylase family protein [Alphaproteobacteria bacterium]|nr:polysaccharide deacetylase family protein [Alphaproteobacteria bacterium]
MAEIAKLAQTARYREGRGYDHDHFEWNPLPERPSVAWPNGARMAWCVYLYLEYLELDPPEGSVRDPRYGGALGSHFPDYLNYSHREHGNRVGFWRVLALLDKYGIKATVPVNAMLAERYPRLVEECVQRGWEIAGHGTSASRMITSRMTEFEERDAIARSLDTLEKVSGTRPVGWFGQDFSESARTPMLLAEAGLKYFADFPNDDMAYATNHGHLIAMPNQAEWDDTQSMAVRRLMPWRWRDVVCEAFDYLHQEAHPAGSVMTLAIHPWLLGQAHRIKYLDEALAKMNGHPNVWQTTAAEAASWWHERAS